MESNLEGITLVSLFFGIIFIKEYFKNNRTNNAHLWIAILFFALTIWVWFEEWTKGLLWVEIERVIIYSLFLGFIWLVWKIIKRNKKNLDNLKSKIDKDEDIVSIGTVKDFNGMKISMGTLKDGSEHVIVFNEKLQKWVKSKSVDMYDVLRSPPWIDDEDINV